MKPRITLMCTNGYFSKLMSDENTNAGAGPFGFEFFPLGSVSLASRFFEKDDAYLGESFQLTGNTLGLVLSGGADYFFSENVGLGLHASLLRGALTSVEMKSGYTTETVTLEDDEQENLSKLDLSLGLVFSF